MLALPPRRVLALPPRRVAPGCGSARASGSPSTPQSSSRPHAPSTGRGTTASRSMACTATSTSLWSFLDYISRATTTRRTVLCEGGMLYQGGHAARMLNVVLRSDGVPNARGPIQDRRGRRRWRRGWHGRRPSRGCRQLGRCRQAGVWVRDRAEGAVQGRAGRAHERQRRVRQF